MTDPSGLPLGQVVLALDLNAPGIYVGAEVAGFDRLCHSLVALPGNREIAEHLVGRRAHMPAPIHVGGIPEVTDTAVAACQIVTGFEGPICRASVKQVRVA